MAVDDSLEVALTEIGFGRWQGLALAVSLLFHSTAVVQQLGSTLLSVPVPFRCFYPEDMTPINLTKITGLGLTDNADDTRLVFPSMCLPEMNLMDPRNSSPTGVSKVNLKERVTGLASCPIVEYDLSTFESTVITEWNLICENSSLRPLFQMTYSIGAILGSLFCGPLSDRFGRKRALQIGGVLASTTIAATSIVPWFEMMIILRVLTAAGTILMLFPIYTLMSEISPASYRTVTGIIPGLMYFASMCILAGTAYLLPHWRKLTLICNSPMLIMVPLIFLMDESPRWLMQKGRTTEAVDLLEKAAKQNGVTLSASTSSVFKSLSQMNKTIALEKVGGDTKTAENQGTLQLFRIYFSSPGMRSILIITPFMWLLMKVLYLGIVINANNFTSSNPFQYVALSGATGVVAVILSFPLGLKVSRRIFIGGALSISGILLLIELAIPSDYWLIKWTMVMVSFCLVCGAIQANYLFSAELFPTSIRTRGFTYTNVVGSIGEMIIPLVTDIAVQYIWWSPSVTFGFAGILGGVLLPLLPETKDKPLPETLQDVEDRYWNHYKGYGSDVVPPKDATKGENNLQV